MTDNAWSDFLKLWLAAEDEGMLAELFELMLTSEERASLETRYLVVKALLNQKISQRQISEELKVSIAKITRGSNELKRISPHLKQFLQSHFQNLD